MQHLVGELGDRLRHGRGEEQRLPLRRKLGDDRADVVDEAHVEHPVGFVEHEDVDVAQTQRVAAHEVEQAARRRDQHVDAVQQRAYLPAHRHAADRERRADAEMAAIGLEASRIWPESSRVGLSTSTRQVLRSGGRGAANRRCRIGSAKAAVLPVPVCAMPMTSRPDNATGMVCDLNWSRRDIFFFDQRTRDRFGEAEVLKRGQ